MSHDVEVAVGLGLDVDMALGVAVAVAMDVWIRVGRDEDAAVGARELLLKNPSLEPM